MIREKSIERRLVSEVKKAGGRAYKWVSPGNRGVPDRIVFLHGSVRFVELKAPGGKLSAQQRVQHELLKRQGHEVLVLSSVEAVDAFMWGERFQR